MRPSSPVGVFFSGIAFIGIALTLFPQRSELQNQREELTITREVWPQLAPGVEETRKDHYCNLILNLQKIAYEGDEPNDTPPDGT